MARVLLLVPSATYRVKDFLEAARALGVQVVVGTPEAHALQAVMGTGALEVPLHDPQAAADAIVAHDRVAPLDAIVAVDDGGTVAAAVAGERLGLRTNAPEAVAAARDKLRMRARLDALEVPQPRYGALGADAGPATVATVVATVGLPCVVKPTTLSGSQGVLRADSVEEAVEVAARVRRIATAAGVDARAPLLVERFAPGPEVAVEGLLSDGRLRVLAVFDKPDPLEGPAFEESIYVTPSRLDADDAAAVIDVTAAATRALGLRNGPVHAEVRVAQGRATVIEVAARTIGGLCSRTLSFSTGRTLEQLVIAQALGRAEDATEPMAGASGVLMLPTPRAGRLVGVEGSERALAIAGITAVEITVAPGRTVVPVPEGNRYLGFVFARARSADAVVEALRRAQASLVITIEPDTGPEGTAVAAAG